MQPLPGFPWPHTWRDAQGPRPLIAVTSSWPTGPDCFAGSFVRALALEQHRAGHSVQILAPACAQQPPGISLEQGVLVHWVGYPGWRSSPFHRGGLPEALEQAPAETALRLGPALWALWGELLRRSRRAGPRGVLLGHWLLPGGWMAQRAAHLTGACATTICHSGAARLVARLPGPLARALISAGLGAGPFVASCAELVEVMEAASGLALAARACVGPMPVVAPRRLGSPPPGPPWRLVTLGRLVPVKGLDLLLEALAGLPQVELHLCGDGPQRPALEAQARELGMSAVFHGVVTGQARDAILSRSHGFVMPSRRLPGGRTEGAPVALLEALSLGLPVVATSVGGIPELLRGRQGAWLVEPEAAALRQGVLALCEALALGSQMG